MATAKTGDAPRFHQTIVASLQHVSRLKSGGFSHRAVQPPSLSAEPYRNLVTATRAQRPVSRSKSFCVNDFKRTLRPPAGNGRRLAGEWPRFGDIRSEIIGRRHLRLDQFLVVQYKSPP